MTIEEQAVMLAGKTIKEYCRKKDDDNNKEYMSILKERCDHCPMFANCHREIYPSDWKFPEE